VRGGGKGAGSLQDVNHKNRLLTTTQGNGNSGKADVKEGKRRREDKNLKKNRNETGGRTIGSLAKSRKGGIRCEGGERGKRRKNPTTERQNGCQADTKRGLPKGWKSKRVAKGTLSQNCSGGRTTRKKGVRGKETTPLRGACRGIVKNYFERLEQAD